MSVVRSSKNKDKLLLDAYPYCRANQSETIWGYYRNNCANRVCFDEIKSFLFFQIINLRDYSHRFFNRVYKFI
jgi:hypothetical protein